MFYRELPRHSAVFLPGFNVSRAPGFHEIAEMADDLKTRSESRTDDMLINRETYSHIFT